jgi:hypothetical protein
LARQKKAVLSEKFNRQFAAGSLVVIGLLLMLNIITRGALPTERTLGLICVVVGVGLWIWTTYYWTATRPAVSRRMAMWRLVGTVLSLAVIPLIWAAAESGLALGAVIAVGITTFLITLAERGWKLAAWETQWIAAMLAACGLFFVLMIPLRFVAYMDGPEMQAAFARNADAVAATYRPLAIGGWICFVFGIGLWVWATRAKGVTPSNDRGLSVK